MGTPSTWTPVSSTRWGLSRDYSLSRPHSLPMRLTGGLAPAQQCVRSAPVVCPRTRAGSGGGPTRGPRPRSRARLTRLGWTGSSCVDTVLRCRPDIARHPALGRPGQSGGRGSEDAERIVTGPQNGPQSVTTFHHEQRSRIPARTSRAAVTSIAGGSNAEALSATTLAIAESFLQVGRGQLIDALGSR